MASVFVNMALAHMQVLPWTYLTFVLTILQQPIASQCTWTISSGTCHVTCPTSGMSSDSNSRRRRQLPQLLFNEDGSISNCPRGQTSCPITGAHGSRHECINTKTDLDNCGGCAATGHGVVCGREPGVRSASCDGGICYIHSCRSGYHLDMHTQRCVVKRRD
ncbi:hypothetical protein AX14_005016 [Amanita brunnescens Koide BX004]|nr:hypothetical protein AX14_005016 [Amanita brunnescens Koide BX004]